MSIRDTAAQDIAVSNASSNKRKRLLLSCIALALCAALLWVGKNWLASAQSFDAERLRIATVTRGDLVRDIASQGRIITANSPTLYAFASGIAKLDVVAGDVVSEGQVLATIDSPELQSQLVQERANLTSLQAEAASAALDAEMSQSNAQKLVDQAMVDVQAAKRNLTRYQAAFKSGAYSKNDLDTAEDQLKKANIGLNTAKREASLYTRRSKLDANNKQANVSKQQAIVLELERQVESLKLKAPFGGQVGQVHIAQGSHVVTGAPVLTVVDLSEFEVEIKVPESFARELSVGVPAEVTHQNRPFQAAVSAVSPEVVASEVSARLRFAEGQQPEQLRQNQRVSVRMVLDTRNNVLMVERGPFAEQGRVWVLRDGIATPQPVQLGARSMQHIEIASGLAEGERIIVSGADLFGDVDNVRINE